MHVVLVQPQIPPNTGNIARLCAATGIHLDLVGELGFQITDRYLKRAGLDYWDQVSVRHHPDVEEFFAGLSPATALFFLSKRASQLYTQAAYPEDAYLVFGSETRGLPDWLFNSFPERFYRIPILDQSVRSLNLSSAAAIVVYEALRQQGFPRISGQALS